eukprot:3343855-Prymnesium_polylepis.3
MLICVRWIESRESIEESIDVIEEAERLAMLSAMRIENAVIATSSAVEGSTSYGICVVIMPTPHRKA